MRLPSGFDTPVQIGRGSFGTVYRARQKHLDRNIIIKIIPLSKTKDKDGCFREAVTQAQLHLPHAPQIYDVFIWEKSLCIIMQWIRSLSLEKFNSMNHEVHLRIAVANELFKAVAALHSQGYAHRDLKPDNILISPSDGVFLIDFGFTTRNADIGRSGNMLIGTPEYMAPELFKVQSDVIDIFRAECYSLGTILLSILGSDNEIPVIKLLTDQKPENRPINASQAYQMWKQQIEEVPLSRYSSFIDQKIRELHSEILIDNIKKLKQRQMHNEAYRLCIECIQETPDHPEAIKIMSAFSSSTSSRPNRTKITVATIAIIATLSFAFFLFTRSKSETNSSVLSVSLFPEDQPIGHSFLRIRNHTSLEYRYSKSETHSLTSELVFLNNKLSGSIFVNGNPVGKLLKNQSSFSCHLPGGKYRYSIISDDGRLLKSEQIEVVPFRKIFVRLNSGNKLKGKR